MSWLREQSHTHACISYGVLEATSPQVRGDFGKSIDVEVLIRGTDARIATKPALRLFFIPVSSVRLTAVRKISGGIVDRR